MITIHLDLQSRSFPLTCILHKNSNATHILDTLVFSMHVWYSLGLRNWVIICSKFYGATTDQLHMGPISQSVYDISIQNF